MAIPVQNKKIAKSGSTSSMSIQSVNTKKDKWIQIRVTAQEKERIQELVNTHKKKSISQYILENILTNNKNKDLNSEVLTKLIDVNTQFYNLFDFIFELMLPDAINDAILEFMNVNENWNDKLIDEVRDYISSKR